MYFKRIEMHGFKSFAEPVTIEFHEGITCVIGPNGSGKSNISDAVRWVLGEQSPKTLRGGKMEEVIFSGTASRKSRGMAEVTFVIDNAKGTLPIDYNEVAITRRMFRSGESEYSINDNQCRLKDIRELIMDTGIGVDGYSLIGQGRISDIISNKAESRREIFEEAAGIVMYRTKKAESERKLSSAAVNLDRVNDIIGELEGRIGGLREDSIKAREFVELRDRYRELEINITLKNMESLELKNEYLKDDILELQGKWDETKESREEADRRLAENKEQSGQLEQLITESREKLLAGVEEINSAVNRGQLQEERLTAVRSNTERIKGEIEATREKLKQEKANAENLAGNKREIDAEMARLNQSLLEKNREHQALTGDLDKAGGEADRYQNEIFHTHSQVSSKKAEIASLENLRETLDRRRDRILEEKKAVEGSNKDTLDTLNKLKAEKEDLEDAFRQLAAEEQTARARHQDALPAERQLAGEMEELHVSMGQLSARKKTIEEMESNYEGYHYAVRHIMKAGIKGIHGVVAELITVPQGFETAIETALGAALQNIVCADDESAKAAITELKDQKAGRLTFLPLASLKGGRGQDSGVLKEAPGFQGFGVDCIKFDQTYQAAMEYLLGRVVIVDNMDHATGLSKKAPGLRIVTLEGEIINTGGAITGGKYRNKTANLLERKAETAELERQLNRLQSEQTAGAARLETLRGRIEEGAEQVRALEESRREAEMALAGKENEIRAAEAALNDLKEDSGRWQQELESIRAEQDASRAMIADLEKEIQSGEAAIARAETRIEEALKLCDGKKQELGIIEEAITAARVEAGACESKKAGVDEILARIGRAIEELQADLQDKETGLEALAKEKDGILDDHTDVESVIKEKQQDKERLEAYLEELTEERAAAAAEANDLAAGKEAADRQANAFQDQKYELEIKKAKNETQMDSCKEKLWEDFEVSYVQAMEFKKKEFSMGAAVRENRQIKARMKELGEVNIGAIAEYDTVSERYEFLTSQRADISGAMESLKRIIEEMDRTIQAKFKESFDRVAVHFEESFSELFGGGHAELRLDDEANLLESGIEIIAQPPGKKLQNINLLSGGEKTMTAIALMFAVLKTKPTPFCILDEVEAALDDVNIDRFAKYLKQFREIQFILVTHQKATMEYADVLYGVTMPEQGVSQILSLDLGDSIE